MTLLNYIKHRLYGYDFVTKPSLDKETIFFPAGYDSMAKIKVDFQNQNLTKDPNDPFEEIIRLPKALEVAAVKFSILDKTNYLVTRNRTFISRRRRTRFSHETQRSY